MAYNNDFKNAILSYNKIESIEEVVSFKHKESPIILSWVNKKFLYLTRTSDNDNIPDIAILVATGKRLQKKSILCGTNSLFDKLFSLNMNKIPTMTKQDFINLICGVNIKGMTMQTRTYYVYDFDSYGQPTSFHEENLSPDMLFGKDFTTSYESALYRTQN